MPVLRSLDQQRSLALRARALETERVRQLPIFPLGLSLILSAPSPSLSLSIAPLMYVLHSTSTPACRPSEIACSFVRSLSPSSLAHSLLAVARSVLPQLALGITFPLLPPTTPANAAPTAPAALRLRPTLPYTWFRAAAAAGVLGKNQGRRPRFQTRRRRRRPSEGGRAGNGGGPLRLVARSHSETEGRKLGGRERKWQRRRRGAT